MTTACLLAWPPMMPRAARRKKKGAFKVTLASALRNVQDSVRRFGADSRRSSSTWCFRETSPWARTVLRILE